ncbi:MAG: hypothetical protein JSV92_03015, partial [archaeon]
MKRKKVNDWLKKHRKTLANLLVFALIFAFLLSYFRPEVILSQTTTSGGDTGSHNYPAWFMKNHLLPQGKLIGWSPGWYAGLPMFQFYFALPYLLMALLSYGIGLQVSFKLVTILGSFLLPVCAFFSMKLMKFRFPVPVTAAVFTLPFLFMEANSMWGGNIPSTLAGEFSYSLSLALLVLFFGSLYRGIKDKKYWVLNGILLALVGLTHVYTLLLAVAVSVFFLLVRNRKTFVENFKYLFLTFLLAFAIMGFWAIPLFSKILYRTHFNFVWKITGLDKVFPEILVPFFFLAVLGFLLSLKNRDRRLWYLSFIIPVAGLFYLTGPGIGIVDIRFVPFIQFFPMIIASYPIGEAVKKLRIRELIPVIVILMTLIWVNDHVTYLDDWIEWNYSGFESKGSYGQLKEITDYLSGMPYGRVVHEFSPDHNKFGTVRTLENIPMFTGKPVLEGLYIESGLSAPYVFYIQSEISEKPTCPLPNMKCSWFGLENGTKHLKLFNVDYMIATSEKLKSALRENGEWTLLKNFKEIEIWRLNNSGKYVELPEYEPVLVVTDDWKGVSMKWFRDLELVDVPLVFKTELEGKDRERFKVIIEDGDLDKIEKIPLEECRVEEDYSPGDIKISTSCIDRPLWLKISYFPN